MTEIDTGDAFRTSGTSKLHAIPKYAEVQNDPGVLKTFNDNVVEEFRANGGKVGGPYEGTDIVLLTMTGAKSGQPRSTPLEYFTIAGRIVLVGSYGGAPKDPAWVHNLRANPERTSRSARTPTTSSLMNSRVTSAMRCSLRSSTWLLVYVSIRPRPPGSFPSSNCRRHSRYLTQLDASMLPQSAPISACFRHQPSSSG